MQFPESIVKLDTLTQQVCYFSRKVRCKILHYTHLADFLDATLLNAALGS